jgi:hypothetical protein
MSKITNKTILKQGDKTYQPIEVDGVIYWISQGSIIKNKTWCVDVQITRNEVVQAEIDEELGIYQQGKLYKIVAQSQRKLDGVPVVSLDSYVERLAMDLLKNKWSHLYTFGYPKVPYPSNYQNDFSVLFLELYKKSNPNQYTQADIEKVIELARENHCYSDDSMHLCYSHDEILEQINSISVIEVDADFDVLSYE